MPSRYGPMLLLAALWLHLVVVVPSASADSSGLFLPSVASSICMPLADQASGLTGLPAEACAIVAHMISQRCLCRGERVEDLQEANELVAEAVEMCTGLAPLVPQCGGGNELRIGAGDELASFAAQPSHLTVRLRGDGTLTLRRDSLMDVPTATVDSITSTVSHTDADGQPHQVIATTTTTTITSAHLVRRTTIFSAPSLSTVLFRLFGTPNLGIPVPDLPLSLDVAQPSHHTHPTNPQADPVSDMPQLQAHTDTATTFPTLDRDEHRAYDTASVQPQMQLGAGGTFSEASSGALPVADGTFSDASSGALPAADPNALVPDGDILSAADASLVANDALSAATRTSTSTSRLDQVTLHYITYTSWLAGHPLRQLLACFLAGLLICFAVAAATRHVLRHRRRYQRHRALAQPLLPPAGAAAPPLHVLMAKGHRPCHAMPFN